MYRTYCGADFETYLNQFNEVGFVESVEHPIVRASGLPSSFPREIVIFETGQLGQVMSLSDDYVEIMTFSNEFVRIGARVARTGNSLKLPVGEHMMGYLLDPLGHSYYKNKPLKPSSEYWDVDIKAGDLSTREKVSKPFDTGVVVVDLMIPLGKGQRELILGDRKTGKTEFLLQTMLTQAKKGTLCIYVAIGRKKSDIRKVEDFFKENRIVENTIIVAASSLDPLGLIFTAPYSAMTIAEYFKSKNRDVLLVLDDMSTHAKFYRELALIGGRFPGRSSYPGDVFYSHSRLLERAGNFKNSEGGSISITCLPVADTVEGDISGYISTNLMSITDGHVYFDKDLFTEGRRPAVNYFLSVTRVGRQTQSQLKWDINRELTTLLTLYDKTQRFVHFGAELSEGVKTTLATGGRILTFFNQPMSMVMHANLQIVLFAVIWLGLLSDVDDTRLRYIVGEANRTYGDDPEFRKIADEIVENSESFNQLLGKVSEKSHTLLNYLKK